MSHLHIYRREEISSLIQIRPGETKLGEKIHMFSEFDWKNQLQIDKARYVLLGIPEDMGVRANAGIGGTDSLWNYALNAILNVQETPELTGEDIMLLGYFNFSSWIDATADVDIDTLRAYVSQIDENVFPVVQTIIEAGKIPIIIGGGHNNAYPLLKAASLALNKPVNCINLDAHSDYRVMEGRHSGNGFRYAKMENYLQRYAIVGLHKNYNSHTVLQDLSADTNIHYSFYEDIFIERRLSFQEAVDKAIAFTLGNHIGVELDIDAIAGALASAATPCGVSTIEARQYLYTCAQKANPIYLHLTEGAISLNDGREDFSTAKLVSYLVTDFIRASRAKNRF